MSHSHFDQLSKASTKVFFEFSLVRGTFNFLSLAVETIWEVEKALVEQSPFLLTKAISEDDLEALTGRMAKLRQGQSCQIEFNLHLSSDHVKQVKVDAYPLVNEVGQITAVAGLVEDVTEQAQYREFLLEFSRKKNNVLQIVAHDLQGPLAIIKGVTSLLETASSQQNYHDLAAHLDLITRAYHDCHQLISQVLLDEHIKSVGTPVKKVRFDVVERVKQMVHTFVQSQVSRTRMEVRSLADKLIVELDEVKFTQILNNLITNSVKFTPPSGRILITVEERDNRLHLVHADTGIGIPPEIQPYLFEKHHAKAGRPGLNGEKPNVIGLSIVKDLVELQGGTIRLESEENAGTTFYLSFPLLA